jgi:hypothetical protein
VAIGIAATAIADREARAGKTTTTGISQRGREAAFFFSGRPLWLSSYDARVRDAWPELPFEGWKDTYETLHRWTQIAGSSRQSLLERRIPDDAHGADER